jgi:hypothetical protein
MELEARLSQVADNQRPIRCRRPFAFIHRIHLLPPHCRQDRSSLYQVIVAWGIGASRWIGEAGTGANRQELDPQRKGEHETGSDQTKTNQ